eukprot:31250-Pelagococcus_subviridis.AAC.10
MPYSSSTSSSPLLSRRVRRVKRRIHEDAVAATLDVARRADEPREAEARPVRLTRTVVARRARDGAVVAVEA